MTHNLAPIVYVLVFASVVLFGYSLIMGNSEHFELAVGLLVGAGLTLVLHLMERRAMDG